MSDGRGCKCCASCYGECSCGADWTPQEVIDLRAENASLAEQNAKMREVLEFYMENGITEPLYYKAKKALALPDLATPAINRIKAEAYRECAEMFNQPHEEYFGQEIQDDLRAKADELEGKK